MTRRLTCLAPSWRQLAGPALLSIWLFGPMLSGPAQAEDRDSATISATVQEGVDDVRARSAMLGVLRLECRAPLAGTVDVDAVARQWWTRNHPTLDEAQAINFRVLSNRDPKPMPAAPAGGPQPPSPATFYLFQQYNIGIFAWESTVALLEPTFQHQLPDAAHCTTALSPFQNARSDFANIESASADANTSRLASAIRAVHERGAIDLPQLPADLKSFEAEVPLPLVWGLTTKAMFDARQHHDGPREIAALTILAENSASTWGMALGRTYQKGGPVAVDPDQAIAWFYRAWCEGDPEGLVEFGRARRDGLGTPADRVTALAAFGAAPKFAEVFDPDMRSRLLTLLNQSAPDKPDSARRAPVRDAALYMMERLQHPPPNARDVPSREFRDLAALVTPAEYEAAGSLTWPQLAQRFHDAAAKSRVEVGAPPQLPAQSLFDAGAIARSASASSPQSSPQPSSPQVSPSSATQPATQPAPQPAQ